MTDDARAFSAGVASFACIAAFVGAVLFGWSAHAPAASAPTPPAAKEATAGAETPDAQQFFEAIVKIQARAVPDARSIASLGREREGTGILIGADGLVLTIGYLIVEADEITLVDHRGRVLPASVVGYDHATGLGLVRAVVPLDATPLPLGASAQLSDSEPVMIVNHLGPDEVTLAYVVSKRSFTGNWEYLLEQAIFTSPPTLNWSGAALVNRNLQLVGVGSLIVREATTGHAALPGNMFVPIDALKPILADLVKSGRRAGPARPWIGVAADEVQGRLVVSRVSPDGPGDLAGVKVGDIILGVAGDGVRTQAEFYRKLWGQGSAGADIPLRVLQGIDVRELAIHSIDRTEYFRPKTTY